MKQQYQMLVEVLTKKFCNVLSMLALFLTVRQNTEMRIKYAVCTCIKLTCNSYTIKSKMF